MTADNFLILATSEVTEKIKSIIKDKSWWQSPEPKLSFGAGAG